ncbi:UNVERIFIED_CONTAM: hypothetical protein K2H54_037339 [Gekko kuhli]
MLLVPSLAAKCRNHPRLTHGMFPHRALPENPSRAPTRKGLLFARGAWPQKQSPQEAVMSRSPRAASPGVTNIHIPLVENTIEDCQNKQLQSWWCHNNNISAHCNCNKA